jgi:hypothetical protein
VVFNSKKSFLMPVLPKQFAFYVVFLAINQICYLK